MRKKITSYILPVALYGIVVVVVFGSALIPADGYLLFGDDIHHQYYFYREFINNFLKQGIFPWWNPYNFSGTPFIANPIANIWYPATWLFFILPLNVAYSWHVASHILWAMLGMYVLLSGLSFRPSLSASGGSLDLVQKILDSHFPSQGKRGNDIFHIGSWTGGLVFGLSGFFVARIWAGHVDVIAAASWMPWVVWAFSRRGVILSAVVLALQLLAGYQTMAIFTMEAVAVLTALFCFKQRSVIPAIRMAVAILLGIGIAAIQLVPLYEFLSQSIRTIPKPYEWASFGSMTWKSLTQLFNPFFFGDQGTYHGPPPNFIEHAAFVGRVGLGLATLAFLVFLRKSFWVFVFAIVAIFGLWVSLGPNASIDLQKILWTLVPIYHSLRIPPRHLILFVFGASALVAFGLQLVKIRAFQLVIAALVVIEMVPFARHFIELRPIPDIRQDQELFSILKKDTLPYRLFQNFGVWIPQRDALEFDATMSKGIFSVTGYDVAILKSYYEFIDAAAGNRGSSILEHDVQVPYITQVSPWIDFLNIKYIMHPRAYDPLFGTTNDRFILIRENTKYDYRLYENKTVIPRFYYVSEARVVPSKNDVLLNIRDGSVNPHTTVLFENAKEKLPSVSPCKTTTDPSITIESYTPNSIELATTNNCDAFMVSSEVFYPGWEAYIDGKKTHIIKGNYAFRILFVPAGRHTIVYVYVPTIFYISAGISVITVCVLLCWIGKRH